MDKIERRRHFFGDILPEEVIESEEVNVDQYLNMDVQHVPKFRKAQKRMQRHEIPEISKHKLNKELKAICKEHKIESDFRRKVWRKNGKRI